MHLLGASVLCELPKSTLEDKFNNKEQNIKEIILIRSCRKSVLSEADFRNFSERVYLDEVRNIVFTISNFLFIPLLLKKVKMKGNSKLP